MGLFSGWFKGLEQNDSLTVQMPLQQAHDQVLAALQQAGFFDFTDTGTTIHAKHGQEAFVYGTVSDDISLALVASDWSAYPITVNVTFASATEASTQLEVHAEYIRPITYAGAPQKGPMADKWRQALAYAVSTVRGSVTTATPQ